MFWAVGRERCRYDNGDRQVGFDAARYGNVLARDIGVRCERCAADIELVLMYTAFDVQFNDSTGYLCRCHSSRVDE